MFVAAVGWVSGPCIRVGQDNPFRALIPRAFPGFRNNPVMIPTMSILQCPAHGPRRLSAYAAQGVLLPNS